MFRNKLRSSLRGSKSKKDYLTKGLEKIKKATLADENDDLVKALQLYTKGVELLYNSLKYDDLTENERNNLKENYKVYYDRLEKLKILTHRKKYAGKENRPNDVFAKGTPHLHDNRSNSLKKQTSLSEARTFEDDTELNDSNADTHSLPNYSPVGGRRKFCMYATTPTRKREQVDNLSSEQGSINLGDNFYETPVELASKLKGNAPKKYELPQEKRPALPPPRQQQQKAPHQQYKTPPKQYTEKHQQPPTLQQKDSTLKLMHQQQQSSENLQSKQITPQSKFKNRKLPTPPPEEEINNTQKQQQQQVPLYRKVQKPSSVNSTKSPTKKLTPPPPQQVPWIKRIQQEAQNGRLSPVSSPSAVTRTIPITTTELPTSKNTSLPVQDGPPVTIVPTAESTESSNSAVSPTIQTTSRRKSLTTQIPPTIITQPTPPTSTTSPQYSQVTTPATSSGTTSPFSFSDTESEDNEESFIVKFRNALRDHERKKRQSTYNKDPEDIATRGLELLTSATEDDKNGAFVEAMKKYEHAVELIGFALKYGSLQSEQVESLRSKSVLYLDRVQTLKKMTGYHQENKRESCERRAEVIQAQKFQSRLCGCILVNSPTVSWTDVVGLESAKEVLKEMVILPIKYPHVFQDSTNESNLRSVLFYGPPGCGKTLLLKAVFSKVKEEALFLSVTTADIISKWVGGTEKLIRNLFELARENKPSIIFLDDMDSLGIESKIHDSHSLCKLKEALLYEMTSDDHDNEGVFLLGATSMPWSLDKRVRDVFDRRLNLELPSLGTRIRMLNKHLKDIAHSLDEKEMLYLGQQTEGFSGSDISCLINDAWMQPVRKLQSATHFKRVRTVSHSEGVYTPCNPGEEGAEELTLLDLESDQLMESCLTYNDILLSLGSMKRSVSDADALKFSEYRKNDW